MLITAGVAAKILGVSTERVLQLSRTGILPFQPADCGRYQFRIYERSVIEQIAADRRAWKDQMRAEQRASRCPKAKRHQAWYRALTEPVVEA